MLPVHVRFSWVSCETDMCVDLGGARCAAWSLVRCCFLVFRKWFYAHNPDPLSLPRRCPLSNGGEHFMAVARGPRGHGPPAVRRVLARRLVDLVLCVCDPFE